MYGSHYSATQVSNISKQMIPKIDAYHNRSLSDKFFYVYLNETYLPLRRQTFAREAAMNDFKQIHQQTNKAEAVEILHNFYAKWGKSYNHVVRDLKAIEDDMLVFYNYPKQIRPSIYSTNMIESFNNIIKRKAKPKAEFPTEQSLDTFYRCTSNEL